MSSHAPQTGIARAHREDCDWELTRQLDKKGLSEVKNREIAEHVVRSHAFKCGSDGDESWGETETAESDIHESA